MKKRLSSVLIVIFIFPAVLFAQEKADNPDTLIISSDIETDLGRVNLMPYSAYSDSEFFLDKHRFGIVFLSSFTASLAFTYLAIDFIRFCSHDWDTDYWTIFNKNGVPYEAREWIYLFAVAGGISLSATLIDYLIFKIREHKYKYQ